MQAPPADLGLVLAADKCHMAVPDVSSPNALIILQARSSTLKRLQVPNIVGTLPLQYSVLADADWLSGPATLNCASANRGDTYKLSVCPLVSGTQWGSLTFMAPDGNYCWYSIEVRANCRHSDSAACAMQYCATPAVLLQERSAHVQRFDCLSSRQGVQYTHTFWDLLECHWHGKAFHNPLSQGVKSMSDQCDCMSVIPYHVTGACN